MATLRLVTTAEAAEMMEGLDLGPVDEITGQVWEEMAPDYDCEFTQDACSLAGECLGHHSKRNTAISGVLCLTSLEDLTTAVELNPDDPEAERKAQLIALAPNMAHSLVELGKALDERDETIAELQEQLKEMTTLLVKRDVKNGLAGR